MAPQQGKQDLQKLVCIVCTTEAASPHVEAWVARVVIYVVRTAQMELLARWASPPSPHFSCHLGGLQHADRISQ